MNYLEDYYNSYNEEGRLLSRHGQVEYLTTMKYIRESLEGVPDPSVLEVGAGTGRYSVTLAKQGVRVTAVELILHNLELLKAKLDGSEPITAMQGLSEAVRVTKSGGYILVAYCMNEPTVVQYVFWLNHLQEVTDLNMISPDWHCISEPKDLFELVRTEDIASLDAEFPVERMKLIASDGATNYNRELIDAMDDATFSKWLDYHFTVCERQDLIGASHHTLDILRKL